MKHIHHLLQEQFHAPLMNFLRTHAGKMGKSLVTIGWDDDTPSRQWVDLFQDDLGFERIMIIEAHRSNAHIARAWYRNDPRIEVVGSSIQEAVDNDALWERGFDTCIWSHGPEHVGIEEHETLMPKLLDRLDMLFLAWTPWGNYYGEDAGNHNPWQRHRIVVPTPEVFASLNLGLEISTCDVENSPNALVWMYKWLVNQEEI